MNVIDRCGLFGCRMVRFLFVLCFLVGVATGKVIDGVVKLSSQDTEAYMCKFSIPEVSHHSFCSTVYRCKLAL